MIRPTFTGKAGARATHDFVLCRNVGHLLSVARQEVLATVPAARIVFIAIAILVSIMLAVGGSQAAAGPPHAAGMSHAGDAQATTHDHAGDADQDHHMRCLHEDTGTPCCQPFHCVYLGIFERVVALPPQANALPAIDLAPTEVQHRPTRLFRPPKPGVA